MTANFAAAIDYVLNNEKGYVNDPADPGGETNFGVSKRQYPFLDVRNLNREDAIAIYKRDYWDHVPGFAQITSARVATKIFDFYVNMSPLVAVRILQMALRGIAAGPIVVDGQFGAQTVAHVNAADEGRLLDELKAQIAHAYCDDVLRSVLPYHDLLGLLRRAVKG
jgi:lysozyme family protein